MTEIELARFRRQLREVSEEAQELTKTLRTFAAQCEEVSRIMRSIRDRYTLAGVPSSPSQLDSEYKPSATQLAQTPELTVIDGGRLS